MSVEDSNLREGIILALRDKAKEFEDSLQGLTRNALVNLLINAANFPEIRPPRGQAELQATQDLFAIKDLQVELAVLTIAEIQRQQQQGEENGIQKEDTTVGTN